MISNEILRKVRRIEIISRKASKELLAGEYHSAFKGRGMEFSQVREYELGDDIRLIDWNVTSRTGHLYVKQFVEEREMTVILALDLSASLAFISRGKIKREVAAEIAALIAFTAMLNNDKVGLLLFTDTIERYIPPQKGRTHLLRIIREILTFSPKSVGTSIHTGLTYLNRVSRRHAIVFLISDFLDHGFEPPLKVAARKHDLVAVRILDPRERSIPRRGTFRARDLESGREFLLDFSRRHTVKAFSAALLEREERLQTFFRRIHVDSIDVPDDSSPEKPLFDFFLRRRRRFGR
ncbi:MAG TPA: DUF58 domain-containing protein [Candidatus Aminicenantes bacterium]|nr:DUF58 domain-containing protein [Candidatus Aminicenantes bacterium]